MEASTHDPVFKNEDVLRDLQSKEATYRELSGSLALLVGTLSIGATVFLWFKSHTGGGISNLYFYLLWLAIAGICTAAFFIFIRPRFSKTPGLSACGKAILMIIAPALICGALIPLWLALTGHRQTFIVTHWIIFYGLALLAASPFAPRSILALGWSFFISGLLAMAVVIFGHDLHVFDTRTATLFMFWTFGLLHLLYGIGLRASAPIKQKPASEEGSR